MNPAKTKDLENFKCIELKSFTYTCISKLKHKVCNRRDYSNRPTEKRSCTSVLEANREFFVIRLGELENRLLSKAKRIGRISKSTWGIASYGPGQVILLYEDRSDQTNYRSVYRQECIRYLIK